VLAWPNVSSVSTARSDSRTRNSRSADTFVLLMLAAVCHATTSTPLRV
jgi:hypothetical protein